MKAIMVVGTTSHAGKSLITTALCRLLARRGWRVSPFKGQANTSNSYVAASGGEIAYPQAVQAWSAGATPWVEMNPVLLKPQSDLSLQVMLKGRLAGRCTPLEYQEQFFDAGWQAVTESLQRLSEEFDMVVCEGSGSPVEMPLKQRDLSNMRIARYVNAPTILVADIDRGGVFAHIIGTLEMLEPPERELIKGIVINKFRGDKATIQSSIEWLQEKTGIPVMGVVPWMGSLFPAEDSLSLFDQRRSPDKGDVNVSVVRLPRIANFTDFDPLEAEPSVTVRYVSPKSTLGHPDAVILPGSKTTIADLIALHKSGMVEQIQEYVAAGGTVMGICGGYQMMGRVLADPEGIEGQEGRFPGLKLLPLKTVIAGQKVARQRQVTSNFPQDGLPVSGYEIHQGRTRLIEEEANGTKPLFDDPNLGMVDIHQAVWGTYLHGIFDNGPWRRAWLNRLRQQRGLKALPTGIANYREQREQMLDHLADTIEPHLDLRHILN
jgi:adenosylcobyric acid synthase